MPKRPSLKRAGYCCQKEASWLPAYIAELTGFPGSKYNDQVDSTAQFLAWIEGYKMNAFEAIAHRMAMEKLAMKPGALR